MRFFLFKSNLLNIETHDFCCYFRLVNQLPKESTFRAQIKQGMMGVGSGGGKEKKSLHEKLKTKDESTRDKNSCSKFTCTPLAKLYGNVALS